MRYLKSITRGLGALAGPAILAAAAWAQSGIKGAAEASDAGGGSWLALHRTLLVGIVAAVLAIAGAGWLLTRRRPARAWMPSGVETETETSRFEQILAEIQGLSLRVKGGAGRGYYRKIEQLVKIFVERMGHVGARALSDEQLSLAMREVKLNDAQVQVLGTILERCRHGALHESEKLDFTATELLKDLRGVVMQVDDTHPGRHA